jgi:cyclopropane-fatty-acyl-phospholipid synthase
MEAITLIGKRTWYESIVLQFLSAMQEGSATITMPSGEIINLGNRGGKVHANITISDKRFFERCVIGKQIILPM